MIEGGSAGGSATTQAAERKVQAERLLAESTRLETVAADERAMASRLNGLPETYAILHDLTLPDGRGRVDHVVIGPGGAFLVLTRRVDAVLSLQHGKLWSGTASLTPLLDGARVEAQALTQHLGTPVVPVIGVVGAPIAEGTPGAVDGVLVCPADHMVHVISRGSHTLLPTTKVTEVADKAVTLLTVAGTRSRRAGAAVPPPPPPPVAAQVAATNVTAPAPQVEAPARPARQGHHVDTHSRKFVVSVIASICLVAFAAGSLLRVLFADDKTAGSAGLAGTSDITAATTIVPPSSAVETTVPATAPLANVPAPKVSFLPVCQAPGAGWSLVPAWPGDLQGLDHYEVQQQAADGTWTTLSSFTQADTIAAAVPAVAPAATLTLQIVAVLVDGSHSPGTPTPVGTPAAAC